MVLARHHAAKAREVAFNLVRADAVEAVGFAVVDAQRREDGVQRVPMAGLVSVYFC